MPATIPALTMLRPLTAGLALAMTVTAAQAFSAGPVASLAPSAGAVELQPGEDIQRAVDANPEGASFHLAAGLYRIQAVQPKNGDSFIGDQGARLDGAKRLGKFSRDGALYVARHQPIDPDTLISGVCLPDYPRCDHPQDLYFDGRPLRAVARRADVVAGTFFYDYRHDAVYFADDPTGHAVELSFRPVAFGGAAKNVTVRNLIVEKYASADQQGAINSHGDGTGWTILDNTVRWNHGLGIVDGADNRVIGNLIVHNGEMGLGGGGTSGALVKHNEIASNVWNGTDCGWECGGAKWGNVSHLTVSGNYVHDNQGDGLWSDVGCTDIVYEDNQIENNLYAGVSHEISGKAVIRNNSFSGNGQTTYGWGWDGQIQIQNSTDTEVYGNTLTLNPTLGGNGIMIIQQQQRGGRHMPHDNAIHDNDVFVGAGGGAAAGWFADYRPKAFAASNLFDKNRYHVMPDGAKARVWAANDWVNFRKWQATGQDAHSTVDNAPR